MKEENKSTGNVTTTSEVEIQPETRDLKVSRNSWAELYQETTALRKHKMLLGREVKTEDGLDWRMKWAQCGSGVSGLFAVICFITGQNVATLVFAAIVLIFFGILCYKNVSFVIAKRLLLETKVVMILVLGLCNWSIDIARPMVATSPILGLIYVLLASAFVFIDALKVKSRVFVMVLGFLFILANINNIYHLIFRDTDQGVVLFKYTIQENDYTIMKRATQRSIFIQVLLFSMNGFYIMFKDKKQELMIFATGHIYHKKGTAHENETDDGLEWRVKWGQRGVGLSTFLTLINWIVKHNIASIVFSAFVIIFFGILYYKNFSFRIAKRLLRTTKVVIIIVSALCSWVIAIARPYNILDPIIGFAYMVATLAFVLLDAMKIKSRLFVIFIGIIFVFINMYNIYNLIFGSWDKGVVLFKYTIQGNKFTFMKRSTKRSIFIQILLFSMNGVYTIFKDQKMEMMIFVRGPIYRETGTASKEVEQKTFVRKIELENVA